MSPPPEAEPAGPPAPRADTTVRASGPAFCSNLSPGRPQTHSPIHVQASGGNTFFTWKDHQSDPKKPVSPLFTDWLAEIAEDRPHLLGPMGFAGENPFTTSVGPVQGVLEDPAYETLPDGTVVQVDPGDGSGFGAEYAIYGNLANPHLDATALAGPPDDPNILATRIAAHKEYMQQFDGITLMHSYTEFGTQMFARRSIPTPSGLGFWEFYNDYWNHYDQIIPNLSLGLKPPSLETWFLRDYDNIVDHDVPAQFLPELEGFKFEWAPWKPAYGHLFRWSINILSEGWTSYWPQVMRWGAYAGYKVQFVDNVGFRDCWNPECRAGFDAWLDSRYSAADVDRLFTMTTSLVADHSFEHAWDLLPSGKWETWNAGVDAGLAYPDESSVYGLYSMRLEDAHVWLHTLPVPTELAGRNFRITVHYKTDPGAQIHLEVVEQLNPNTYYHDFGNLGPSTEWTSATFEIGEVDAGFLIQPNITSFGRAWIDEIWVTDIDPHTGQPNYPQFTTGIWEGNVYGDFDYPNRPLETLKYWDSVVDGRLGLLRDAGRSIEPTFDLYLNSGRQRGNAGYFMIERKLFEIEVFRDYDIGYPPGRYLPGGWHTPNANYPPETEFVLLDHEVLTTNIFDYEVINARRFDDEFAYASYLYQRPGMDYRHNYSSALLQLAETAAFGGGAAADLQLHLNGYYQLAWELLSYRKLNRDFFEFVKYHAELYECMESIADVALVVKEQSHAAIDQTIDLAKDLERAGIPYEVLVEGRFDPPDLSRYQLIILHDVKRLLTDEASNLVDWVEAGGQLILSGSEVGQFDDLGRLWAAHETPAWQFWHLPGAPFFQPVGSGAVLFLPAGLGDIAATITSMLNHSVTMFPGLSPDLADTLRGKVWTDGTNQIVHVLDYDVPVHGALIPPLPGPNDVLVRVPAAIAPAPDKAVIYYPPTANIEVAPVTPGPFGTVEFTVPHHRIYSAALLFKTIEELHVPVDCEVPNCIFDLRPWIWVIDPPWEHNILDQLPGPAAQHLSLAGKHFAFHEGQAGIEVSTAISGDLANVLASDAMFLSPVERDRDVPATTQAVTVPRGLTAGAEMYEIVATPEGLDVESIGNVSQSASGSPGPAPEAGARAVYSATERAIFVAGQDIWGYEIERREWTRWFGGTEPREVLGVACDPWSRKLSVLAETLGRVALDEYDLGRGTVTRHLDVEADPARTKLALTARSGAGWVITKETSGGAWESWSLDLSGGATWTGHAIGTGALLDDPLFTDAGTLLSIGGANGLTFVELDAQLIDDGRYPEQL